MELPFVLDPGRGLGPVSFGMTRAGVADVMARAGGGTARARSSKTDCYFGSGFQVTFGDAGRVDFIELASGLEAELLFVGRDVFDMPAAELVELISRYDTFAPELSRPPGSYIFPNLIVTLWGPDTQYDYRGDHTRPVFAAVGVGRPDLPRRHPRDLSEAAAGVSAGPDRGEQAGRNTSRQTEKR